MRALVSVELFVIRLRPDFSTSFPRATVDYSFVFTPECGSCFVGPTRKNHRWCFTLTLSLTLVARRECALAEVQIDANTERLFERERMRTRLNCLGWQQHVGTY